MPQTKRSLEIESDSRLHYRYFPKAENNKYFDLVFSANVRDPLSFTDFWPLGFCSKLPLNHGFDSELFQAFIGKERRYSDTEIEVLEIDKQATSEQPCSSSATGDLDHVNSDCEDLSDQDCEVPEGPSASASSISEPPCKQRKLHDFMDSWTKSRPWFHYDNEE